jgi:hypothetical protein
MTNQRSSSMSHQAPLSDLRAALQNLYLHRGEPSTRTIAKKTGGAISHTTVNNVLRCVKPPRWGQLELVVLALGGDVETFREAWIAMRSATEESTDRGANLEKLDAEIERLRHERDDLLARLTSRGVHVLDESDAWNGSASVPTVLRIMLGAQLRRLRSAQGISREQAGWEIRASGAKIGRMELGRVSFKERDLLHLLTLYGVTDPDERQTLLALSRQSDTASWWHRHGSTTATWFQPFLELEAAASLIRTHETHFVPGLLQTPDYARAVFLLAHDEADTGELQRRVDSRMARKKILTRHDAPQLWVIIDEAVVRRPFGDRKVMREQIAALIEAAELPNVTLQITPFDMGGYDGPFTLLRFPDQALPDVVYLEQLTSALYLDKHADVDRYNATMARLVLNAAPKDQTLTILKQILAEV